MKKNTRLEEYTENIYEEYTEQPYLPNFNETGIKDDNKNTYVGLIVFLTIIATILFALLAIHFVDSLYKPYKEIKRQKQREEQEEFRHNTILALLPDPQV